MLPRVIAKRRRKPSSTKLPNIGVDIMLVDVEDWGDDEGGNDDSWALGTQYWARNMHQQGYHPMYGILLDMVGAADASFLQEYYSMQYAPAVACSKLPA